MFGDLGCNTRKTKSPMSKPVLYSVPICIHLLLVLGDLQILLEDHKNVLAFLYPIYGFWSPVIPKSQINKWWIILLIQCPKWGHPNGWMISGVVVVLPEMQPFDPCLLLPWHIVMQPLNPFIHNLCLAICLRMIIGTRGQFSQNALINLPAWSLTIFLDNPWSLNTSLKNNSTTCVAL